MTDTLIVPTFDEPATAAAGRKLVIICSKGNLDMAYPGLILGSAALGEGIETHLFFTFWGLDMITTSRMDDLKFTMLGNTAMHLTQAPKMPIPAFMGGLPGMTGRSPTSRCRPSRRCSSRSPRWAATCGPAACRST
jgi:hypothetical protein